MCSNKWSGSVTSTPDPVKPSLERSDMHTLSHPCSDFTLPKTAIVSPAAWPDTIDAELAALEAEIDARRNDEAMLYDSTHCRECGHVTAGTVIAGCHVQACDGCIVKYVREQIGAVA